MNLTEENRGRRRPGEAEGFAGRLRRLSGWKKGTYRMDELRALLQESLNGGLYQMTAGGPRKKDGDVRMKVRPVMLRDRLLFQAETFRGNQVFHRNLTAEEACEAVYGAMADFRQLSVKTESFEAEVLVSKKGKVTVRRREHAGEGKKIGSDAFRLAHNRKRNIFWRKDGPYPFSSIWAFRRRMEER